MFLQKYKIVIGGTLGAGKINAIQSLSKTSVLSIESINIDSPSTPQNLNRVLIDYGEVQLDEGVVVGLYATPTDHIDYIGAKLCADAIGAVILIDHTQKTSIEDLEMYADSFKNHVDNILVGITHTDQDPQQLLKKYRNWLSMRDESIPLFAVDTRRKDDVLMMIQALIARADVD